MPVVVSGKKVPDPYMAVALSDSAGLEGAWTHAIALINNELFAGHLVAVPYWVEPPAIDLHQ